MNQQELSERAYQLKGCATCKSRIETAKFERHCEQYKFVPLIVFEEGICFYFVEEEKAS